LLGSTLARRVGQRLRSTYIVKLICLVYYPAPFFLLYSFILLLNGFCFAFFILLILDIMPKPTEYKARRAASEKFRRRRECLFRKANELKLVTGADVYIVVRRVGKVFIYKLPNSS
jgi:SRF-type transcription factor (DNA-binding and dimerisation domain)